MVNIAALKMPRGAIFQWGLISLWLAGSMFWIAHINLTKNSPDSENQKNNEKSSSANTINIVIIICGEEYIDLASTALKSAIFFRESWKLHAFIFCEPNLQKPLDEVLQKFQSAAKNSFAYEFRDVVQKEGSRDQWRCTMDRLYLPDFLSNVDKILYVDLDVVFTAGLTDIWSQFDLMNSTQMCGLALDFDRMIRNIFDGNGEDPLYRPDLNDGIMLLDLKKMRQFKFTQQVKDILKTNTSVLTDQDIYNIILRRQREKLLLLPCRFNIHNACHFVKYQCLCKDAATHGISIVHSNDQIFLLRKDNPPHKLALLCFYIPFLNYELGTDPVENLIKPMKKWFSKIKDKTTLDLLNIYLEKTALIAHPQKFINYSYRIN